MSTNRKGRESTAVRPWSTHGLTSLVMFTAFLDSSLLVIAFPSIRRSFASVSTAELSWILNAYTSFLEPCSFHQHVLKHGTNGSRAFVLPRKATEV